MFHIPMTAQSPMAAGRSIFHDGLRRWGCGNVAEMTLVFAELVTNATRHTAAAERAEITHMPPIVRIAVHDHSQLMPELRYGAAQGGFGLHIIDELSEGWGWNQTPTGKVVWSIIHCGH